MKPALVRYVKAMKKLFIAFSAITLPAIMILMVFAFNEVEGTLFIWITLAVAILYFVVYGIYSMRVSMGTVTEVAYGERVVYIKTPRKIYTYSLNGGCVDVKVYADKFVATFETQDSRDSYILYRKVPFSSMREEQFTVEEIARFYPNIQA